MKFIANGFATEMPEGWQDRSMITMVGPAGASDFAPNVVIMREQVSMQLSIEEYAARQRLLTVREIPDLEVLDERPAAVNGAPAFQRLQRFTAHGRRLQQAQTYVLGYGVVFALTFTATLEQFNESIPAFRHILDHFQISAA